MMFRCPNKEVGRGKGGIGFAGVGGDALPWWWSSTERRLYARTAGFYCTSDS